MIDSLNRFVAYICSECSGISDCTVSVFDFSGEKCVQLDCKDKFCECSSGTLGMKNDKMQVVLNCPVCTEKHTFTISKSAFWSKELITFDCLNSGIPIFFAGEKNAVIEAVNESEKLFDDLETDSELLTDELKIVLETLDALHYVMEEKRLICRCGSRNLFPVFESDSMFVECEDCKEKFPIKPSCELLKLLTQTDNDLRL